MWLHARQVTVINDVAHRADCETSTLLHINVLVGCICVCIYMCVYAYMCAYIYKLHAWKHRRDHRKNRETSTLFLINALVGYTCVYIYMCVNMFVCICMYDMHTYIEGAIAQIARQGHYYSLTR